MVVSLDTPVGNYLALCETRGANPDGDCKSFAWVKANAGIDTPLGAALDEIPEGTDFETAIFAFQNMLDVLDQPVREKMAEIINKHPSKTVHALSWRRLMAAVNAGAPMETENERVLLRSSWHSDYNEKSLLPEYEAVK